MFTLEQIKAAHALVKTGADFPTFAKNIAALGVIRYETHVSDGRTLYIGSDGLSVQKETAYAAMEIAANPDIPSFRHYLKIHQQGETGFPAFCRHCAETGVEKWVLDIVALTCTYYDLAGNEMLQEKIIA